MLKFVSLDYVRQCMRGVSAQSLASGILPASVLPVTVLLLFLLLLSSLYHPEGGSV